MRPALRWIVIVVAGALLLLLPSVLANLRGVNQAPLPASTLAPYTPPVIAPPALAATPIPTSTPIRSEAIVALPTAELRRGPIVVDLAHYSLLERARFQPLAAALSTHGLDLRFWLPTVDTADIERITDFPDLSEELTRQLADASALVVISPFFLYTPAETAVVERFLADGGRLLIISDPDVESDSASDTNQLSTAFNVIFNQDYLYDTVENDENFTYFFQDEFLDAAADLQGSRIAFYGGRSIGGAVQPQVRSADTTLSSLRNGLTGFNTVVLGGLAANNSSGRVLAMSDFDVLTDPYVARHDNRRMLQFVADFLAGAVRINHLADFPSFLGKEVALAIDHTEPVGALSLATAAELQRVLEASGRTLRLGPADAYTRTAAGEGPDLIYVGGYRAADAQFDLLSNLGIELVEEVVTPTVTAPAPAVTPGVTPAPAGAGSQDASDPLHPAATPAPPELPDLPDPGAPAAPTPLSPPEVPPLLTPDAPADPVVPGEPAAPASPVPTTENTPGASPPVSPTVSPTISPAADPPATVTNTPDTVARFGLQQEPAAPVATITGTPGLTDTAPVTVTDTVTGIVDGGAAAAEMSGKEPVVAGPEPQVRLVLARSDGLRLLADETLLYIRRTHASGTHTLAILGNNEAAINAAMTRLLSRDFSGCLAQEDLVVCPYSPGDGAETTSGGNAGAVSAPASAAGESAAAPAPEKPGGPMAPDGSAATILVVDDNAGAEPGEASEAAIYLVVLSQAGYALENWFTSEQGMPTAGDLRPYQWVIWSDAGYASSGIATENLQAIGEYINEGGRLTISSRKPFFGMSANPPSVIRDIVVTGDIPELSAGLPDTPILLAEEPPSLTPLEENTDPSANARSALARGPASAETGAPVLLLLSDEGFEEPKGALLMLFGLSMNWLPPEINEQLILNMAAVMLED